MLLQDDPVSDDDSISSCNTDYDEEVWDEDSQEVDRDIQDNHCTNIRDRVSAFVHWILCSILFMQCSYSLSNACVEHLLLLFHQVFSVFKLFNDFIGLVSQQFPLSMYMLRKIVRFDRDDFTKYVVCPHCTAIYRYHEVVKTVDGRTVILKCSNVLFGCRVSKNSDHRGRKGKFPCNAELVKEVQLRGGRKKYYPLKSFCYKSVIDSLETFLCRPSFQELCNQWRSRDIDDKYYGDIYDGEIWKKFQTYNGQPFLSQPNNYSVMINVDWFQPFKRRRDVSVGVMYLVFMNLPRHLRFKTENIILLGIIPAMKKEPESLNQFLKPVIDELKFLSRGFQFEQDGQDPVNVKVLLLCASSDIPAARKLCGFMGHKRKRKRSDSVL